LTADEQLGNYYLLIRMLSTYPNNLPAAYSRAYEMGDRARTLFIRNATDDTMAFNNIIPLYELIAVGQYNAANLSTRDEDREQAFLDSIEWFGYLEELNVDLTQSLAIKKANAYKGVFDAYNTPARRDRMDASAYTYLNKAIEMYEEIIRQDARAFLSFVNLTHAYYDREMLQSPEDRDFTLALQTYRKAKSLANTEDAIPSISIMQFSSLTKLLQNAGLEV
jgi:serine/threonine-protein kinase